MRDYAIPDLYLAASPNSKTKLLTGFKAAPFVEPATGLAYFRARWYDPATGTFLTPDPVGYRDSSNLYAYAGGDPVNLHDPTGRCIGLDSVECSDYALDIFLQFHDPRNAWGNLKRSARFAAFEVKGAVLAIPTAVKGTYYLATHLPETAQGLLALADHALTDPIGLYRSTGNALINADSDRVGETVGEVLFFAGAGAYIKTAEGVGALGKATSYLKPSRRPEATRLAKVKQGFSDIKGQGIYEFRGRSGKVYVGKSKELWRRLFWRQNIRGKTVWGHVWSGKLSLENLSSVRFRGVTGSRRMLRVSEQRRMNFHGGLEFLENKRNELGKASMKWLEWKRYQIEGFDVPW